jgi:radical SAM superfamily enzyme YgiQ (UPF0313 family)
MGKRLNILLIQYPYLGKSDIVYPLGLNYIAQGLKWHNVELFDSNVHKRPLRKIKLLIKKINPDIIGISLRNIVFKKSFLSDLSAYFKYIKAISPRSIICVGGSGFSLDAKVIMQKVREIDFGVFLRGDESFSELINNLDRPDKVKGLFIRNKDEVLFTGERNSENNLLPLEYGQFDITPYRKFPFSVGVLTKMGCVFNCSYCHYGFLSGNKLLLRNAIEIVNDIEKLTKLGMASFYFTDNVFNFPQEHAIDICSEIIKRNLNLKWRACFHLKYINKDSIGLFFKSGCEGFVFSPDGYSKNTLSILGKKDITVRDIVNSYDMCLKMNGVKVYYYFLNGIPFENGKDVLDLFRICIGLKDAVIRTYMVALHPQSELYKLIRTNAKVKHLGDDYFSNFLNKDKLFYYKLLFIMLKIFLMLRCLIPEKISRKFIKQSIDA